MEYVKSETIDVTPLLFNSLSENQAILVKQIIESYKGLFVIDSYMTDDSALIIIEGMIGNREDYIHSALAKESIESKIPSDDEALMVMNDEIQIGFMNIKKDFSSTWD